MSKSTLSLSGKLASRQFLKCSAPLTSRRFFHISSMDFRYVCLLSCHLHFSFFLLIISDYISRHWHHCCIFRLVIPSSFSLISNQLCHLWFFFKILCSSNSSVSSKNCIGFQEVIASFKFICYFQWSTHWSMNLLANAFSAIKPR